METERILPVNLTRAEREVISAVREGELEIDEEGRVWRVAIRQGKRGGGIKVVTVARRRAERQTRPDGYLQVHMMRDGKEHHASAHRLVWMHFFGEIPLGLCIHHTNGNKQDNRPCNLMVTTYSGNQVAAHKDGLIDQWGERNPLARRTDAEMKRLREMYARKSVV